jgi:hypothetical protein
MKGLQILGIFVICDLSPRPRMALSSANHNHSFKELSSKRRDIHIIFWSKFVSTKIGRTS